MHKLLYKNDTHAPSSTIQWLYFSETFSMCNRFHQMNQLTRIQHRVRLRQMRQQTAKQAIELEENKHAEIFFL